MATVNNNINYRDRIEIESLNVVGSYSLKVGKMTDNECKLCSLNLLAPSLDDLEKGNINVCVAKGACGHAFHKSCIDTHYAENNLSCPIDATPWNTERIINLSPLGHELI